MNPFMDQYPSSWMQSTNINSVSRLQFRKANMTLQYCNWLPGPEILQQDKAHSKWMARDQMNKFNIDCRASAINPCTAQATVPEVLTFPVSGVLIFGKNGAPSTGVTRDKMMYRDEDEIWPTNPAAYNKWGKVATNTQMASMAPTKAILNAMVVLPGMVWQNRGIYLQGLLWAKILHTGGSFHPSPLMGGFGFRKPFPQIS